MRYGLLVLAILGCVAGTVLFFRAYDDVTTAALSDDARLAVDVGCRGKNGYAKRECRAMLKKLYLSRSLDPDKTLRAYCDSIKSARWGGSSPPPPRLCVERYGGWPTG